MNNGSVRDNPAIKVFGRGPRGTLCRHCDHIYRGPAKYGTQSYCKATPLDGHDRKVYRFWYTCGLYAGPDAEVEVVCPNCLKKRKILRSSLEGPDHKELCSPCSRATARPEKDKESGPSSVERRKAAALPLFNGCSPKPARKGRCGGLLVCPAYPDCLRWAMDHNWSGWKEA